MEEALEKELVKETEIKKNGEPEKGRPLFIEEY